ncbi:MAG: 3-hydroxyacyl-ACP dehydratase FabZ [Burkholderiales bacterium]
MTPLEIRDIMGHLPHRFPFLLVDRVLEYESGKHIVALKNVTINEPFFPGHFPNHPVMPGVLVIEAMAQTAAILAFITAGESVGDRNIVYFAGIDDARFKRPVVPGDQIMMRAELTWQRRGIWRFKTTARVDEHLAAEASLMCTMRPA